LKQPLPGGEEAKFTQEQEVEEYSENVTIRLLADEPVLRNKDVDEEQ